MGSSTQPVRFSILAALDAADEVVFGVLRDALGVSDSVLSHQISLLEEGGYVRVRIGHVGKRPRTWLSLARRLRVRVEPRQHRPYSRGLGGHGDGDRNGETVPGDDVHSIGSPPAGLNRGLRTRASPTQGKVADLDVQRAALDDRASAGPG